MGIPWLARIDFTDQKMFVFSNRLYDPLDERLDFALTQLVGVPKTLTDTYRIYWVGSAKAGSSFSLLDGWDFQTRTPLIDQFNAEIEDVCNEVDVENGEFTMV